MKKTLFTLVPVLTLLFIVCIGSVVSANDYPAVDWNDNLIMHENTGGGNGVTAINEIEYVRVYENESLVGLNVLFYYPSGQGNWNGTFKGALYEWLDDNSLYAGDVIAYTKNVTLNLTEPTDSCFMMVFLPFDEPITLVNNTHYYIAVIPAPAETYGNINIITWCRQASTSTGMTGGYYTQYNLNPVLPSNMSSHFTLSTQQRSIQPVFWNYTYSSACVNVSSGVDYVINFDMGIILLVMTMFFIVITNIYRDFVYCIFAAILSLVLGLYYGGETWFMTIMVLSAVYHSFLALAFAMSADVKGYLDRNNKS